MTSITGTLRKTTMPAVLIGVLLLLTGWLLAGPGVTTARADTGDRIDSYKVEYTVAPDGTVHVQETIAYHFGSYGRHGIYRNLVIREPYVDANRHKTDNDQLYKISDISVKSPSGAPTQYTATTNNAVTRDHREQQLQLKIGSPSQTISGNSATYVIGYDVQGALRHFGDHSEFVYDVLSPNGWDVDSISNVSVSVTVPDGVTQATCYAAPLGGKAECQHHSISGDGIATFSQDRLGTDEAFTVVAAIKAGAVSNDTPIIVAAPSLLDRAGVSLGGIIPAAILTVLAPVGAFFYHRRGNKDKRFAGMPPGTFPPPGTDAAVEDDTLAEDQIPVAFSPPKIPVAEGGLLIDATANTRETAATLIDLAVRGGIKILDSEDGERSAQLLNPAVATAPHEQALLRGLFPTSQPGDVVLLQRGEVGDRTMLEAHTAMIDAVRSQVSQQGWYSRMPSAGRGRPKSGGVGARIGCGILIAWFVISGAGGAAGAVFGGSAMRAVVVIAPILAVIVSLVVVARIRGRGQRSPLGRALDDQLVGFRRYLATAEADQLKFEEGEDIFSKYLPWAIVFDLADRWQRVCEKLVQEGRIPPQPGWYYGPGNYWASGFMASSLVNSVSQSFSPPPTPSGSGGGGGSSSGFGGGGFAGGGGGGGGGGSW